MSEARGYPAAGDVAANPGAALSGLRGLALVATVIGIVLGAAAYFLTPEQDRVAQAYRSYLYAYMFWLGIPLGSLGLTLLQHLTGGQWAFVSRRFLEAGMKMLPVMAVLFIPIVVGMDSIYKWTDPDPHRGFGHHADLPAMWFKKAMLQRDWFLIRAAIYFVIWIGMGLILNGWSKRQDRARSAADASQSLGLSAPMLLVFVLTVTGAAVDWVMSIDPMWFSTIFGVHFVAGQALSTLCVVVILLAALHTRAPFAGLINRNHFHDLGKLMFAFTMLWAYINLSQFLIIWMGNIKEETPFYIVRSNGSPGILSPILIVLHFFVPFLLLLSQTTKRSVSILSKIAAFILLMRIVDMAWIVKPTFDQSDQTLMYHSHPFTWLDLAMPVAVGGVFALLYVLLLGRRSLLAPNDARLAELVSGGHH
jgi:hypothetical protein